MSDAPDRIWVDPEDNDAWFIAGSKPRLRKQDIEYIRSDSIPWERIEEVLELASHHSLAAHQIAMTLLRDIFKLRSQSHP